MQLLAHACYLWKQIRLHQTLEPGPGKQFPGSNRPWIPIPRPFQATDPPTRQDWNESSTSRAVGALGTLELDVGARVPSQTQELTIINSRASNRRRGIGAVLSGSGSG